jgi:hypothetical protein
VPDYRAYIVGPDGHFKNVRVFAAVDRDEATKSALQLVDGHAVELWEGEQWIGTFEPDKGGGAPRFKRLRMARRRTTE